MRSKQLEEGQANSWVLVLETGDEFSECLNRFAVMKGLTAANFIGIGAFRDVVLGYFDWERKDYKHIPMDEQLEVLTLTGDVSLDGEEPKVHAHVILGRRDASTCGGHLLQAHVRPTLELVLRESPENLRRAYDPKSGLNLIRP